MLQLLQSAQDEKALVQTLEKTRKTREWKYSTTLTMVGALHGAVANPFLNRELTDVAVRLRPLVKGKRMQHYEKCLRRAAVSEDTRFPRALLGQEVPTLLRRADAYHAWPSLRSQLKALIVLSWAFAARVGDVLQLKTRRVRLANATAVITWTEGKSVAMSTQGFTVASHLGPHAHLLASLLAERKGHDGLFSNVKALRKALLKVLALSPARDGKRLELRSFRRGAGASMDTLRLFSRHRDERTLLRYLNWGQYAMEKHALSTRAALHLWPEIERGVDEDGWRTSKSM